MPFRTGRPAPPPLADSGRPLGGDALPTPWSSLRLVGPVDVLEGQLERLGPGPRCLALNISRRPSWGEEEELAPPWPRLRVLQGVLPRLRPARAPTRAGGAELRDCECEHSEGATTFSEDARDNETWHTVATVK